jgi:hypothetical protein
MLPHGMVGRSVGRIKIIKQSVLAVSNTNNMLCPEEGGVAARQAVIRLTRLFSSVVIRLTREPIKGKGYRYIPVRHTSATGTSTHLFSLNAQLIFICPSHHAASSMVHPSSFSTQTFLTRLSFLPCVESFHFSETREGVVSRNRPT